MWQATVRGRKLTFHLAGINNENFIMRDEETGSWWQQVSGEAIRGPLKGERLIEVPHDELTFATWTREQPGGRVLRPDPAVLEAKRYASAEWEEKTAKAPVVTVLPADDPFPGRELVVGVTMGSASRAYPLAALRAERLIMDVLDGVPIALVIAEDGRSVRAFDRRIDDRVIDLFIVPDVSPLQLLDAGSGSTLDFTGSGTSGSLLGRSLRRVAILQDYWFDWRTYHPDTQAYTFTSAPTSALPAP